MLTEKFTKKDKLIKTYTCFEELTKDFWIYGYVFEGRIGSSGVFPYDVNGIRYWDVGVEGFDVEAHKFSTGLAPTNPRVEISCVSDVRCRDAANVG